MLVAEKVHTFGAAFLGVMVIEFAALVAFCMTCFPIGYIAATAGGSSTGIVGAFVIGGLAGVVAGGLVTYFLLTRKRRLARKAGKP